MRRREDESGRLFACAVQVLFIWFSLSLSLSITHSLTHSLTKTRDRRGVKSKSKKPTKVREVCQENGIGDEDGDGGGEGERRVEWRMRGDQMTQNARASGGHQLIKLGSWPGESKQKEVSKQARKEFLSGGASVDSMSP